MKIGIIDADLLGKKRHRFPNLASMKIAGYYKDKGNEVDLLLDYNNLDKYDKIFISKVFTDTKVPDYVLKLDNVKYGGTGFFYDKAEPLPYEIEHHMPFYDLYNDFIEREIKKGINPNEFKEYKEYSIGFTTRGCFRKCEFCVNKNSNKVVVHSPLSEFVDNSRPYICLLDDNILGYPKSHEIFKQLNDTGKRFKYKQGMDERLLTDEKCKMIANSNFIGDIYFAFDNIEDKEIIINKMKLMRKYTNKIFSFYVLCGFDRQDKYDEEFWVKDIIDTFERIYLLKELNCRPYIMRFEKYKKSPFYGIYNNIASWCNQPNFFKKMSFEKFCITRGMSSKVYTKYKNDYIKYLEDGYKKGSSWVYMENFKNKYNDIAKKYFYRTNIKIESEDIKLGNTEVEQFKWII